MNEQMTGLVEFWMARLEEKAARTADPREWARVVREIDADRLLVRKYEDVARHHQRMCGGRDADQVTGLLYAVKCRVSAYADHADYRQEWAPDDSDLMTAVAAGQSDVARRPDESQDR